MKILITGASGFIGREVIGLIKKKDVACLIRKKNYYLENKVKTIICDLDNKELLLKKLKGFDTVVHIAGIVNTPSKKEFYHKNVELTKNLLKACTKNKVKRLIYISTAVVISEIQGPYSSSKIQAEKLIKKSNLDYIILRPSLVYGEKSKKGLAGLIKIVKKYPVIPIVGSGTQKMQPVYVNDIAKAIISAIYSKNKRKVYFIAGPKNISFENLIDLIAEKLNKRIIKIHIPPFIPVIFVSLYQRIVKDPVIVSEQMKRLVTDKIYDISKSKKDLNLEPLPIEKGINRIIK